MTVVSHLDPRLRPTAAPGPSAGVAAPARGRPAAPGDSVARAPERPLHAELARARPPLAAGPGGLTSARFVGSPGLARVASGRSALGPESAGEPVGRVQQALIDLGFGIARGVTGRFDRGTAQALARFQREVGLRPDGRLDAPTLAALDRAAPPPGKALVRSVEYDRLYAGGRLDVTVAIGFDEDGSAGPTSAAIQKGLAGLGFRPVEPADRARLGLDGARFDPKARYLTRRFEDPKDGRPIDAVVRMIEPDAKGTDGAATRARFRRALGEDEVVIYSGHARYGSGPDFDPLKSGAGNLVISPERLHGDAPAALRRSIAGRPSELGTIDGRPAYQVLMLGACTSEDYLDRMRDPASFRRDRDNTDVIASTAPLLISTGAAQIVRAIDGLMRRESNDGMLGALSRIERDAYLGFRDRRHAALARHAFTESGFLGNRANRLGPADPSAARDARRELDRGLRAGERARVVP